MYKAIFLDIDDTIFDFELCSRNALKDSFLKLNIPYKESYYTVFKEIDNMLWSKQKSGKLTVEEVLNKRFKILFRDINIDANTSSAKDIFKTSLSNQYIFTPNAYEIIEYLYGKYEIYAASNGNLSTQLNRLKLAGILEFFKDIFVSDDIGYEKPNINFFKESLRRGNLKPSEVFLIGDSIEADIIGGKNYDIDTCWYNPNNKVSPYDIELDCIISNLIELKKRL